MNNIQLFQKTKIIARIFHPRHYVVFKSNFQYSTYQRRNLKKSSYLNGSLGAIKCFSNCNSMQTKDSDPASDKSDDEKIRKMLEDDEFRNILKDFANDFGVDNETNELLDDIRKNIKEDHEKSDLSKVKHNDKSRALGGGLDQKFKEFLDDDSSVIPSVEETKDTFHETFYHIDQELKPKPLYSDLKRGVTGVFDIHEMIQVLHNESLLDIVTISVPKERSYADFLVLATARSERHSAAVVESINKIYKKKKNEKDPFIIIVGEDIPDWKAMDFGNIVLHVFLEEKRAFYDVESNWLLDSEYDSGGTIEEDHTLNEMEELFESYMSKKSNPSELTKDSS